MSIIVFPSTWTWDEVGDFLESREADGYWLNEEPQPVWVCQ